MNTLQQVSKKDSAVKEKKIKSYTPHKQLFLGQLFHPKYSDTLTRLYSTYN